MAGWSAIRLKSAKELRKNPNAFFYRHVAPHEKQVLWQCPVKSSDVREPLSATGRQQPSQMSVTEGHCSQREGKDDVLLSSCCWSEEVLSFVQGHHSPALYDRLSRWTALNDESRYRA